MIRHLTVGVLGATVAILALHAALTVSPKISISTMKQGFEFKHIPEEPAVTELSSFNLKREAFTKAIIRQVSGTTCQAEMKGNLLHRFCFEEGEEDDLLETTERARYASWRNGLTGIEDHTSRLQLDGPIRVAGLETEEDDLSIR